MSFLADIKRNQLAIISLLVAFMALGYNTWRNELTEHNRNLRTAGFEMLVHVAELRRISYLAHYDQDTIDGNPRKGWAEILVLQDLASLMPAAIGDHTVELTAVWQGNWEDLGKERAAVEAIDSALDQLREAILAELAALD